MRRTLAIRSRSRWASRSIATTAHPVTAANSRASRTHIGRCPRADCPRRRTTLDGHTWHHPDRLLFEITKFGGQALAPPGHKSNMPAFGQTLSDEEIWAVLAFIKSRWPEEIRARQAEITRANP